MNSMQRTNYETLSLLAELSGCGDFCSGFVMLVQSLFPCKSRIFNKLQVTSRCLEEAEMYNANPLNLNRLRPAEEKVWLYAHSLRSSQFWRVRNDTSYL